ncbi:2565_t:CDS:2 [Paraglomus occultum]|uniref:2565_t:CDS:1 n=1 Tax=Paraglomus occultum TaxID=144539 RepID=A0A9N9FMF4_9GLOM|nr:2565_t:CDS:2 [Paraglomus occultum]
MSTTNKYTYQKRSNATVGKPRTGHIKAPVTCTNEDRNSSLTVLSPSSNEEDNVCINDQSSASQSRREPRQALADKTNTGSKTVPRNATRIGGGGKRVVKNAKDDSDRDSHCANNANDDNNKEKTKQQARPKELQTERELKRLKRNSESEIDSEYSVSSDTKPTRTHQSISNLKKHQPRTSAHAHARTRTHLPSITNTSTLASPSTLPQDTTPRRVKRSSPSTAVDESSSSSDDPILVYSWYKESTLCSVETRGKLGKPDS